MVSSTGVGGFTLGGGVGWLMRSCGLAIDNLAAASVVVADGRRVQASPDDDAELFYGLRGAGGGLGVVTSFLFRLHSVRHVLAGIVIRPPAEAATALRTFRDFALQAPDEYCGMIVLAAAPPLPFLDAAWHGRPVVISAMCWNGEPAAGERALAPLRQFGSPLVDHVGPMPYVQWQHLLDAGAPPGRHNYWKTASYLSLDDSAIDTLATLAGEYLTRFSEIHVQHLGGAVARVPESQTAFSDRHARFFVNLIGMTPWAEEFPVLRERVRMLHAKLAPQALPSLLPNFSNLEDGDPGARLAAPQAARVAALRRRYDPAGLFAMTLKC
jgi:FAD/FMN-containing dehydrogenase